MTNHEVDCISDGSNYECIQIKDATVRDNADGNLDGYQSQWQ